MKSLSVTIPANPQHYDIVFPEDAASLWAGLKKQIGSRDFLLVTDMNVMKFTEIPEWAQGNLLVLPAGEQTKRWHSIGQITTAAFENHLDKGSVFVSLGGGVITDMVGFAAMIFLRGIPVIHIPTSLLGMVDASIGGKTGIDSQFGKNLLGGIHQPEQVICGKNFLETLPERELKNGVCEMIKHGILGSKEHFDHLKKIASPHPKGEEIFELVSESLQIKASIVERDVLESGERMKLNLGHTFGHAIELLSDFETPHGQAVAMGTMMATQYALDHGICDEETADQIEDIFNAFEIDTLIPYDEDDIWAAMAHDKKIRNRVLRLILPAAIGEVVIEEVPLK